MDHRNANAAQQIVMRVGMNVMAALIDEASRLGGDVFTVETGVR